MDFKELTEYCQAVALMSKILPDEGAVWRYICRKYSAKFSTPLDQVQIMDPEHVILNVYEEQLDELNLEQNLENFLDMIYTLEDPAYEAQKKQELGDFISQAEKQESDRIKAGKPIHPRMAKDAEVTLQDTPQEQKPKGGKVDLSYLEKEESTDF
jgi:hypothetical protein